MPSDGNNGVIGCEEVTALVLSYLPSEQLVISERLQVVAKYSFDGKVAKSYSLFFKRIGVD